MTSSKAVPTDLKQYRLYAYWTAPPLHRWFERTASIIGAFEGFIELLALSSHLKWAVWSPRSIITWRLPVQRWGLVNRSLSQLPSCCWQVWLPEPGGLDLIMVRTTTFTASSKDYTTQSVANERRQFSSCSNFEDVLFTLASHERHCSIIFIKIPLGVAMLVSIIHSEPWKLFRRFVYTLSTFIIPGALAHNLYMTMITKTKVMTLSYR